VSFPEKNIAVWSKKVNERSEGGERQKKYLGNGATDA
jgi:hypothetical protein